jgi:hypothetical protein
MPETPNTDSRPATPLAARRPWLGVGTVLTGAALLMLLALGYCATQLSPARLMGKNETRVTHDVVIQQIRAVAKLVSSEATVRDVILYENTWYGSTKRSLVVVTGRLLAGIDLRDNPQVSIDHAKKRIAIVIPPAKLIALEIRDMRTYDERGGLWNPFKPSDREAIQRQARTQLMAAGNQMELIRRANESAMQLLTMLLAKDGYVVDVSIRQPATQFKPLGDTPLTR